MGQGGRMGKEDRDKLRTELEELFAPKPRVHSNQETDFRVADAVRILTRSVLLLDESSERLSKVNIGLTVVILFVGIVQIVLMVRGH
jgi:hypothetical protein